MYDNVADIFFGIIQQGPSVARRKQILEEFYNTPCLKLQYP